MALYVSDFYFLEITNINIHSNTDHSIGKNALVHFVSQDDFGDVPTKPLHGKTYERAFKLMINAILLKVGQ